MCGSAVLEEYLTSLRNEPTNINYSSLRSALSVWHKSVDPAILPAPGRHRVNCCRPATLEEVSLWSHTAQCRAAYQRNWWGYNEAEIKDLNQYTVIRPPILDSLSRGSGAETWEISLANTDRRAGGEAISLLLNQHSSALTCSFKRTSSLNFN